MPHLPLQLPLLDQELVELLRQIPRGRVTTYGRLAAALGAAPAARWVGHYLLHHQHTPSCVCHRVVRADGAVGSYYTGQPRDKIDRLAAEQVEILNPTGEHARVDLARFGYDDFASAQPLARLIALQNQLAGEASETPLESPPELIGGVDVSYTGGGQGVAAYALVEVASGELVWSTTHVAPATFPYISTLLSFRELPLLLPLLEQVRRAGRLAEVVLVDGSGRLHPRGAGIATHLGVLANQTTVGITKKLLLGQFDRDRLEAARLAEIRVADRPQGAALLTGQTSRRPIFVSPGHQIDVRGATQVAQAVLCGRRLPEPIYWADRLSRAAAREAKR